MTNNNNVRNRYINEIKTPVNRLARELNYKTEDDFVKYIDMYLVNKKWQNSKKLSQTINSLRTRAAQHYHHHPAIATIFKDVKKPISQILNDLSIFHQKNSGCFRYKLIQDKLIREKISGNFCHGNEEGGEVPESEHPLYNINKWDCEYRDFSIGGRRRSNNNPRLKCNGLCDPNIFNGLSEYTPNYGKAELPPIDDKYIYVCESGSILRYLLNSEKKEEVEVVVVDDEKYTFYYYLIPLFIVIIVIIIILACQKPFKRNESILDYYK